MSSGSKKIHHYVREKLSDEAIAKGRKIYLSSAVKDLNLDIRRRRYSGTIDYNDEICVVKIEHTTDGPTWVCTIDGRDNPDCAHVAALITAIREREASETPTEKPKNENEKENLVDHIFGLAEPEHLEQALRLAIQSYPELQGDFVFTVLENIDKDGSLYGQIVDLIINPENNSAFEISGDGFDTSRLIDEIWYLYEKEQSQQCILLCREILIQSLDKLQNTNQLTDDLLNLIISTSNMLANFTFEFIPVFYQEQVNTLVVKILKNYQNIDPELQSNFIALLNIKILNDSDKKEIHTVIYNNWLLARADVLKKNPPTGYENFGLPLALFYARTADIDSLEELFNKHLKNPIYRAPALVELYKHDMHDVVSNYINDVYTLPDRNVKEDNLTDIARCEMLNDLLILSVHVTADTEKAKSLCIKGYRSIGYRKEYLLNLLSQFDDEVELELTLKTILKQELSVLKPDHFPSATKCFALFCELKKFDEALRLLESHPIIEKSILLYYYTFFKVPLSENQTNIVFNAFKEKSTLELNLDLRALLKAVFVKLLDENKDFILPKIEDCFEHIEDDELADFIEELL